MGVKFLGKKRYITLEWPPSTNAHLTPPPRPPPQHVMSTYRIRTKLHLSFPSVSPVRVVEISSQPCPPPNMSSSYRIMTKLHLSFPSVSPVRVVEISSQPCPPPTCQVLTGLGISCISASPVYPRSG